MRHAKILLVLFITVFVHLLATIQQSKAQQFDQEQIIADYKAQRERFPREKIYVHFDRPSYSTQDTIWFKVYIDHNLLQVDSSISHVVHVALVDATGQMRYTCALPSKRGVAWGAVVLNNSSYPPGSYTFWAYTQWMMNFDQERLFSRSIPIFTNEQTGGASVALESVKKDIDLQFMPEGGSMVVGLQQRIAFKAIDERGKGIALKGTILNSKNETLQQVSSNSKGMGSFFLQPHSDETYHFIGTVNNDPLKLDLPTAKSEGIVLQVDPNYGSDSLQVMIQSTAPGKSLFVVGQSKGELSFVANLTTGSRRKVLYVGKNLFGPGVSQILVLNNERQVVCSRSFFVHPKEQMELILLDSLRPFAAQDHIPIHMMAKDRNGLPVLGSFSVAVTDDSMVSKDSVNAENILNYMLLSSDLKGEIEDPGFYFGAVSEQKNADLDALLLTQGWVDYGTPTKLKFKPEVQFQISGRVNNMAGKGLDGAKVTLFGQNKSQLAMIALTDKHGEFRFDQFPVLDSAKFFLQAVNANHKSGTIGIKVDQPVEPVFKPSVIQKSKVSIQDTIFKSLIKTKEEFEKQTRPVGITLKEVNIKGKKVVKSSKNLNGPGEASQTLNEVELSPLAKNTLHEVLLQKINGFRDGFRNNNRKDYFVHGNNARFIIDGHSLDLFFNPSGVTLGHDSRVGDTTGVGGYYDYVKGFLDYFNAEDLAGIEVMENHYGFSYNGRFGSFKNIQYSLNPVNYTFIEITTKNGMGPFLKKAANVALLGPINYGNNKNFYHPKYTSGQQTKVPTFRPTLYWNPNLVSDQDGKLDFSFYASERKGSYTIWIEGVDTKRRFMMKTVSVSVK